jgi:hypothetical protein
MGADWSRRSRPGQIVVVFMVLGTFLAYGEAAGIPVTVASEGQPIGSSCAHPWQASYQVGGPNGQFEGDLTLVSMGTSLGRSPRLVQWSVRSGYVICSARIQLADGRWVGPTRVEPYPTPTPIGGEYQAPQGPHSPLRGVFVTAARSSVPPGANCNYPLFSGFAVDGAPSQKSDIKDFTVKFKLDSENKPGETAEGDFTIFQAEVAVMNPRLVMCRLVVNEFKGSSRSWPLTIGPHGGLSSRLTLPVGLAFGIAGYARLEPTTTKPISTHPSTGCSLTNSGGNSGAEIGDTKDFGVEVKAVDNLPTRPAGRSGSCSHHAETPYSDL